MRRRGSKRRLSSKLRATRDRILTEFFRWLPAVVFFGLYAASGNFLFFTYAIAFSLWPHVRSLSGQ